MEDCSLAVAAQIDGRAVPATLTVHGSIMAYGMFDEPVVTEAVPQGFNPRVLVLDVAIAVNGGPMKGTCKPFHFEKHVEGRQYDQVQVRADGKSQTVDVTYLG